MNAAELEQGTQEWLQARLGHVTASRVAEVLAKPRSKGGESSQRRNYRAELVAEILSGKAAEQFETFEMKRGRELEPLARAEYEMRKNVVVDTTGFIVHPRIARCGASPDGLIGTEGLVQFKCPKTATHLDYLMGGIVPVDYRPQMMLEMAVTGAKWNDFVSYEPRLPDHLQLFVVRLNRNDSEIAEIEAEIVKFLAEVDEIISKLPQAV